MIIEVRNVGFLNKGAELMLRAILQKIHSTYPEAILTIVPSISSGAVPFQKLVNIGFYPKASITRCGYQLGDVAALLPKNLRERYGIILDREVDVILDASGFAYSDQWGVHRSLELAHSSVRWRKNEQKVILLPQAFGPFENPKIRNLIDQATNNIDLVMARDKISFDYLSQSICKRDNIRQYPDFTNLIDGKIPAYFDQELHRICLVPNYRMIDKTDPVSSDAYIPFMVRCANYLKYKNENPFILIHEGENDKLVAEQISQNSGGIPIITESDPLNIKGILGASFATIGSRFHGLVSALSQGVPSLGTGWSHKYLELFRDYDVEYALTKVDISDEDLSKKIDWLTDIYNREQVSKSLLEKSKNLKSLSNKMWQEVIALIDNK